MSNKSELEVLASAAVKNCLDNEAYLKVRRRMSCLYQLTRYEKFVEKQCGHYHDNGCSLKYGSK